MFVCALLVPLGDLLERRRLVTSMCLLSAAALASVAMSSSSTLLYVFSLAVGLFSTTAQMLVAFAASLAAPEARGKAVGTGYRSAGMDPWGVTGERAT